MASMLAPFAPHFAQELLRCGGREHEEADPPWPRIGDSSSE
jgi:leucyl-tRNA synthetase